jgi:4-amino-4-deoxy-L-arabinose transferase-like glycosyltransferase
MPMPPIEMTARLKSILRGRSDIPVFALILALGTLVRLTLLQITNVQADVLNGDSGYYLAVADNLVRHGVHSHLLDARPTYYRPPGYPLLIAAIFNLGGNPTALFLLQAASTIVTACGAVFLLRSYDRTLARMSGLFIAACPFFFFMEVRILAEILFGALIFLAWLLLFRSSRMKSGIVAGILLGAATLMRETVVLLPAVLVFCALLQVDRIKRLKQYLIVLAAALVTIAPWPIRNSQLPGGSPVLSEGRGGFNLWVGTWERDGDWIASGEPAYPADAFRSANEQRILLAALARHDDGPFQRIAIQRIVSQPVHTAQIWVVRYPRLWLGTRTDLNTLTLTRGSMNWTAFKSVMFGLDTLMLLFAAAGFAIAAKRQRRLLFFAIPVLYTAAIYVPFHNVEPRFSLVTIPFLLIFSALGFQNLATLTPFAVRLGGIR